MADLAYTTADAVTDLAGQVAVDLRTDDAEAQRLLAEAIAYATGRVDYYCSRYAAADLAASQWVKDVATFIATRFLCQRRLNKVPKAIAAEWKERQTELEAIRTGAAVIPRVPTSRRPASVTNYHTDLRRVNNQGRVVASESTGVAKGYRRPTDPTAPDQR